MPRKLSAHYIFPGGSPPLKRGVVIVDDQGCILDVMDTNGNLTECHALEFYDGIIVPGFPSINDCLFPDVSTGSCTCQGSGYISNHLSSFLRTEKPFSILNSRTQDFPVPEPVLFSTIPVIIPCNHALSGQALQAFAEIMTIHQYYPQVSLFELINWSTINVATFLHKENSTGSIAKGKKTGLNLITGIDFDKMQLTSQSKLKILM